MTVTIEPIGQDIDTFLDENLKVIAEETGERFDTLCKKIEIEGNSAVVTNFIVEALSSLDVEFEIIN